MSLKKFINRKLKIFKGKILNIDLKINIGKNKIAWIIENFKNVKKSLDSIRINLKPILLLLLLDTLIATSCLSRFLNFNPEKIALIHKSYS